MKLLTLLIMLFITQAACTSQSVNDEPFITIYYVDYEIITPFKITSEYYNNVFIKETDSIKITDTKVVDFFIQSIKELKISETTTTPDVRQKIIINNLRVSEEIVLYSDGEFAMMRNDKVVIFDPKLQMLINEIINGQEKNK